MTDYVEYMSESHLAYRALVRMGYRNGAMASLEAYETALSEFSLEEADEDSDEPTLLGALAIRSFGNVDREDYERDTYRRHRRKCLWTRWVSLGKAL